MNRNENVLTEKIIPMAAIIAFVATEMWPALKNYVSGQTERF